MKEERIQAPGRRQAIRISAVLAASALFAPALALAGDSDPYAKVNREAQSALRTLYSRNSAAKAIGAQALAVLVFPRVTKAGFIVGGQYGDGTLLKAGKPVAHYNTAGVSAGFQAGAQAYGYAMFFMNETALAQLDKADGFEIGVGPSVVIVDEGFGKNITTTTLKDDIYAFVFSQKGLMAGVGIQGNKISRVAAR
jgi:lipid-binding SYLF domain-containing protein